MFVSTKDTLFLNDNWQTILLTIFDYCMHCLNENYFVISLTVRQLVLPASLLCSKVSVFIARGDFS